MKNILSGIAFLLVLFWFKGARTVQASTTDLSNNFTQIKIADQRDHHFENNQILRVEAEFSDQAREFKNGDMMTISWKTSDDKAQLEGISQEKDLIVKEVRIGTYTVKNHSVLVHFNENVEKVKGVSGKFDFYVQIHNPTTQKQEAVIRGGQIETRLQLAPEKEDKLFADINGYVNSQEDDIDWEIKLNPEHKEFIRSLIIAINLPESLEFDSQLKVTADGKLMQLDKDDVQYDQDGLVLRLTSKEYSGKSITVQYHTRIFDKKSYQKANQFLLTYQLTNDQKTRKEVYEGRIINDQTYRSVFKSTRSEETAEETRQARKREDGENLRRSIYLSRAPRDKQEVEPVHNQSVASTHTPIPHIEAAEKVNPHGLTGFDKKYRHVKSANLNNLKADYRHSSRANWSHLPKTSEAKTIIFSIVGCFILALGGILLRKTAE